MPTIKTRINLTVPEDLEHVVQMLALRDQTSLATKTLELLRKAIDIEEDASLLSVSLHREKKVKKGDFLSHEEVWS